MSALSAREQRFREGSAALPPAVRAPAQEIYGLVLRIEWCIVASILWGLLAVIPGLVAYFFWHEELRTFPLTSCFFGSEPRMITGLLVTFCGSWALGTLCAKMFYFDGECRDVEHELCELLAEDALEGRHAVEAVRALDPSVAEELARFSAEDATPEEEVEMP